MKLLNRFREEFPTNNPAQGVPSSKIKRSVARQSLRRLPKLGHEIVPTLKPSMR